MQATAFYSLARLLRLFTRRPFAITSLLCECEYGLDSNTRIEIFHLPTPAIDILAPATTAVLSKIKRLICPIEPSTVAIARV
jgi:hypothetical protein